MKVFVTGATGFIGTATTKALLDAGHQVLGLARSEASASALRALGAEPHEGSLRDLASLRSGAAASDAVIHLAFGNDFSRMEQLSADDLAAIGALGEALAGTHRPLLVSSGALIMPAGGLTDEDTPADYEHPLGAFRGRSERLAFELAATKGVAAMLVRFAPVVHGDDDWGFVPMLAKAARESGAVPVVGSGENRWSAVHKNDAARLLVAAVERPKAGAVLHAIAEPSIAVKSVADAIGKKLGLPTKGFTPEEAKEKFGFIALPLARDNPVDSKKTRELMGWTPRDIGLLEDIEHGNYF